MALGAAAPSPRAPARPLSAPRCVPSGARSSRTSCCCSGRTAWTASPEEILFVSGPLLVGVIVRFAPPAAGVALSAVLVWAGTLAFALSPVVAGVRPAAAKSAARSGGRWRGGRALVQPVVVATGVGLSLGAVDLLVMVFAQQRRHGDDVVAWVLAALSVGSALGGLLNGAVAGVRPHGRVCRCRPVAWASP